MLQNFIMKYQKFQKLHRKQATEVPLMKKKIRGKIIKNLFPTKMVQPIPFTYIISVNVTRKLFDSMESMIRYSYYLRAVVFLRFCFLI